MRIKNTPPASAISAACLSVFIGLLAACAGIQNKSASDAGAPAMRRETGETEMLFLVLSSYRDAAQAGGQNVRIVLQKRLPGAAKRLPEPQIVPAGNYLVCSFLDESQKVLDTQTVEDPLFASMEYPDDNGTMGRVQLNKTEAEFVLRTPYDPALRYLRVEKPGAEGRRPVALLKL